MPVQSDGGFDFLILARIPRSAIALILILIGWSPITLNRVQAAGSDCLPAMETSLQNSGAEDPSSRPAPDGRVAAKDSLDERSSQEILVEIQRATDARLREIERLARKKWHSLSAFMLATVSGAIVGSYQTDIQNLYNDWVKDPINRMVLRNFLIQVSGGRDLLMKKLAFLEARSSGLVCKEARALQTEAGGRNLEEFEADLARELKPFRRQGLLANGELKAERELLRRLAANILPLENVYLMSTTKLSDPPSAGLSAPAKFGFESAANSSERQLAELAALWTIYSDAAPVSDALSPEISQQLNEGRQFVLSTMNPCLYESNLRAGTIRLVSMTRKLIQ